MICMMLLTYADNVVPLMFVETLFSGKFHMCSVSVKLKLFNSYCASMYTLHLWWNYKMSICKLQITYHNILKMNIGLSKCESTIATSAITNTQCCQFVIRNLVYAFVCRLDKSKNTIVKALLSFSIYSSRVRSHWRGLLYVHSVQYTTRRLV